MERLIKLFSIAIFVFAAGSVAAEDLVEIDTPRGVSQKFLLMMPEQQPLAIVLLFAGGKGALNLGGGMFAPSIGWGKNNFLVRTRKDFAKHGFIVATVDAPSDRQGKQGMYGDHRTSTDHVSDIDSIIAKVRETADVPVWLIGTSRGTESAAFAGLHSTQNVTGIVLTSSMTESNRKGLAVTELPLDRIMLPTLVTHHRNDGCAWTTPGGAERIRNMLTAAPVAELKLFEGGYQKSKPCKAKSYHGYLGIENQVVDAIAAFIKSNS